MSLGEGASVRIVSKAYATGAITANAQPVSATDPGATGGQILRRVESTMSLSRDSYSSNEMRDDRQVGDFRLGTKKAEGSIKGEWSPGTYFDFIEAACRGTRTAALSKTNTDYTSVAADSATSTFTFAGGDPVADGFKVGMVIKFTSLTEPTDNAVNYLITGFSGTNNRVVSVSPAPTTMAADTSFSVISVGKRASIPPSGFVSRKFALEHYHSDLDLHRLFTECRVTSLDFNLPASGMSTIEVGFTGRDMETGSGAASPFFMAPTNATTTGILAAVNGLLLVQGVAQGVITGAQIKVNLNPTAEPVVGQVFVPEIFLGRADVSGQFTAFFQDLTLLNYFVQETEVSALLYLTASNLATADFVTIHLPRLKFGKADIGVSGMGGVPVTLPFTALRYLGSAPGVEQTTFAVADSAAA